jgi:dienelactone hydrolase
MSAWHAPLILLAAWCWLAGVAAAQERVVIPLPSEAAIEGVLYRPDGPGPFPAVIALHGCSGLNGPQGVINRRHHDWAKRLVAAGHIVLLPDSYGPRGLGPQCLVKDRTIRPNRQRVMDALGARDLLLARSDVKPAEISLLGWSNGALSVLWSINDERKPRDGQPDFKSAVVFYPGCRGVQQAAERQEWNPRIPTLMLIGEADTWTPVGPCRELAGLAATRGRSLTLIVYPDAVHGFDHPQQPMVRRSGLAFTGDGSGEALTGTHPEARADALTRVPAFLANP